jgi:SAM-dependent methyltransferase
MSHPSPPEIASAGPWNERFKADGYWFGEEPNGWLRRHAGVWQPGQRVLCVADGEGRNSVWLAQQGLVVEAFDVSPVGVAKARRLANARRVNVNLQVADCETYAWPQDTLDGVAAIFIQFAEPSLRDRLFARMVASLRPGGVLLLQGYTPQQLAYGTGGPPWASHMYTAPLLRQAFSELEMLVLEEYEAHLDEGPGHQGRSALIGLVAMRRR